MDKGCRTRNEKPNLSLLLQGRILEHVWWDDRSMARLSRVEYEGAIYHITIGKRYLNHYDVT